MSCTKCEEAMAVNMPCDNCDKSSPAFGWADDVTVNWSAKTISFKNGTHEVNIDFNKIIDLGKYLESSMMMDDLNSRPLKKSLDQHIDSYDTKFLKK